MGCPEDFILRLKSKFNIDEFVETGTYKGNTSIWAAKHFATVQTVENSKVIFDRYAEKLSKHPNIIRHFGNSSTVLSEIINKDKVQLFWLDAHWCGGDTYGVDDECPLIEELELIKCKGHEHSIILVDDARLFLAPPPEPHIAESWPTIQDVFDVMKETHYTAVFEDVIFAGGISQKAVFVKELQVYATAERDKYRNALKRPSHKLLQYASFAEKRLFE